MPYICQKRRLDFVIVTAATAVLRRAGRLLLCYKSFINDLQINSLRIRTGNFLLPNRELNQAFREFSGRIQGKRPMAHVLPGAGGAKAGCAMGPSGLTRQPCSPKRLGHRIAASGRGIVPACGRRQAGRVGCAHSAVDLEDGSTDSHS
jgi:hypothetical protein